jgi:hypothetical protein
MTGDTYKIDFDQTCSKSFFFFFFFFEKGNLSVFKIEPKDNNKAHKETNKKLTSLFYIKLLNSSNKSIIPFPPNIKMSLQQSYEELMDNKIQANKICHHHEAKVWRSNMPTITHRSGACKGIQHQSNAFKETMN